jgi:signal transduction histidine kinase
MTPDAMTEKMAEAMAETMAETTWAARWCGAGGEPRHELVASVRLLRQRPWVMAVSAVANFVLLRLAEFPTRRFVLLLATTALPIAFAMYNAFQARTPKNARAGLWRALFASDVFVPAVVTVTGGLRSPFMPVLLVNVIIMVVLWRRRQSVHGLLVAFVLVTGLLAVAPSFVTGPLVRRPYFELMAALNLVSALYLGAQIVSAVSDGFVAARRTLFTVRERVLDSALQRMRSLEQVGSKVAHELKNPLAAIKSLLQLEEEAIAAGNDNGVTRPNAERSRRRLEVMSREVVRMEAVLRDYLSFSRPLEDLRVGVVDLTEMTDAVVLLLEGRAAAAGVRLVRAGQPVGTIGDGRRLEEALLNVASNAIEATPAGGSVTIRTELRDDGAAIVVQDTGKGMGAPVLEKLGTPFFTTRREGTGLGVVLARAVLAQHGGRLEYASRAGEGTTATLALPNRPRQAETSASGLEQGPRSAA